jgi:Domain of unknown function (DUF1931)
LVETTYHHGALTEPGDLNGASHVRQSVDLKEQSGRRGGEVERMANDLDMGMTSASGLEGDVPWA